jgi:type VI secretion system protein VasJ
LKLPAKNAEKFFESHIKFQIPLAGIMEETNTTQTTETKTPEMQVQETQTPEPQAPEIQISEFVQEYLEPIPGDSPAGTDAGNEEEFFKLNMEIPKTTPDYKKCIELAEIILKEKSKDIKVAAWLCFALFRTEKVRGLRDGLNIMYCFLKNFENNLFPQNEVYRSKAIQFINTPRFFKLVEREDINKSNANEIIEAETILNGIISECQRLFPDNVPVLKSIKEAIETHAKNARKKIAPPKKEAPKPVEDNKAVKESQPQRETTEVRQAERIVAETAPVKISSEKDAIAQLRQTLLAFFETVQDGAKKEKVPENYFVFGISRQLQWSKLIKPPETDKVTQIDPPNQIIQGKVKEWFAASNWDTLIPRIEISFLRANSEFIYWLDSQRYICIALEQKGGNYNQAAGEIKIQLAGLVKRIPDLLNLKFKDKQTPFADSETVKWINDEVKTALGGGKGTESILPPIIGEDYDLINKEYETACSELPEKFEENFNAMQAGIETDTRRKGKFLRKLNLANYCILAKHPDIAKVHLFELKDLIEEYNLAEWEPALCTAVWQSLYSVNAKLIAGIKEDGEKNILEKEQKELFARIAKHNGLLALKISQKNKT